MMDADDTAWRVFRTLNVERDEAFASLVDSYVRHVLKGSAPSEALRTKIGSAFNWAATDWVRRGRTSTPDALRKDAARLERALPALIRHAEELTGFLRIHGYDVCMAAVCASIGEWIEDNCILAAALDATQNPRTGLARCARDAFLHHGLPNPQPRHIEALAECLRRCKVHVPQLDPRVVRRGLTGSKSKKRC